MQFHTYYTADIKINILVSPKIVLEYLEVLSL